MNIFQKGNSTRITEGEGKTNTKITYTVEIQTSVHSLAFIIRLVHSQVHTTTCFAIS